MRFRWALIPLSLATALLTSCGGDDSSATPQSGPPLSAGPSTFNVPGTMTITDRNGYYNDGDERGAMCTGDSGYDDIGQGTQVVVRDSEGKQLALGELGPGGLTEEASSLSTGCQFGLMVFGVPTTSDIYTVEVSHRGQVSFTREDLAAGLHLTLE